MSRRQLGRQLGIDIELDIMYIIGGLQARRERRRSPVLSVLPIARCRTPRPAVRAWPIASTPMAGREVNRFRGALAVAGALSLGAGGVVAGVGVEGGAAGAAVVRHRSPAHEVLAAAHGTKSAKAHGTKTAKSHGTKSAKSHGTKHRAKPKGHGGALPVIGHAKDLSAEPVVHADKQKPPTKLLVKNLVVGTGATATRSSTVKVKYVGADFTNGKDFTAITWRQHQSTSFSLKRVIVGFSQGIAGMRVGGRREIVIPPKLGYGKTAQGPIKANETLVFVVDLEGVS